MELAVERRCEWCKRCESWIWTEMKEEERNNNRSQCSTAAHQVSRHIVLAKIMLQNVGEMLVFSNRTRNFQLPAGDILSALPLGKPVCKYEGNSNSTDFLQIQHRLNLAEMLSSSRKNK